MTRCMLVEDLNAGKSWHFDWGLWNFLFLFIDSPFPHNPVTYLQSTIINYESDICCVITFQHKFNTLYDISLLILKKKFYGLGNRPKTCSKSALELCKIFESIVEKQIDCVLAFVNKILLFITFITTKSVTNNIVIRKEFCSSNKGIYHELLNSQTLWWIIISNVLIIHIITNTDCT